MGVFVTCTNEEDPFKKEVARYVSHCKSMQIFMMLKGS